MDDKCCNLEKLLKEYTDLATAAYNLDEYIIDNPSKIIDIPNSVYEPFEDAVHNRKITRELDAWCRVHLKQKESELYVGSLRTGR